MGCKHKIASFLIGPVVVGEGFKLHFEIAGQEIVFQKDAVL